MHQDGVLETVEAVMIFHAEYLQKNIVKGMPISTPLPSCSALKFEKNPSLEESQSFFFNNSRIQTEI